MREWPQAVPKAARDLELSAGGLRKGAAMLRTEVPLENRDTFTRASKSEILGRSDELNPYGDRTPCEKA